MSRKILGILGGMGSEASVDLYRAIVDHTVANNDREHLDMMIMNHASMPDRTEYILSGREEELWNIIKKDILTLRQTGCEYFAIPCNTSHYFADRLQELTGGAFINMIEETAAYVAKNGCKKVGVMATDGTVQCGLYAKALEANHVEVVYPDAEDQKIVMSLIYDQIKKGEKGNRHQFFTVADHLKEAGCDAVILACTELSVFHVNHGLDSNYYIDAMDILAKVCIEKCGAKYCE